VVSLEVSAGTNIKVLEAMACGKAVVSTPVGCQGLDLVDEVDAVVRESWREFAGAVSDLLADAGKRRSIGGRARVTVEERFSWTAVADRAYASYRVLTSSRRVS
jgi:glycosyltransferase involved in cell wall biosynthesis